MSAPIVIHGFETSNNMKVRVALGYKGLPHEFRTIQPGAREEIVGLSGQHLTPVMVHGDRVLFDSAAILRYLEANFPGTPRLFGTSQAEQWEIEDWELFARTTLAGPMMEITHCRGTGGSPDEPMLARCGRALTEAAAELARRLAERGWLVGDAMSAADVTAAPVVHRIRTAGFLPAGEAFDPVAPWVARVMEFDGGPGRNQGSEG